MGGGWAFLLEGSEAKTLSPTRQFLALKKKVEFVVMINPGKGVMYFRSINIGVQY